MIQTLEGIVSEHPFFKGLEERHIQLIVGCAKNVRFDEGEIVFTKAIRQTSFISSAKGWLPWN
jgi:CRP/FNR family cyclic AMP-dependent transcriptional regulator